MCRFSEIQLKQQIGAGGFGFISSSGKDGDNDVAAKLLGSEDVEITNVSHLLPHGDEYLQSHQEMRTNFINEVKVMTTLRHPNGNVVPHAYVR